MRYLKFEKEGYKKFFIIGLAIGTTLMFFYLLKYGVPFCQ